MKEADLDRLEIRFNKEEAREKDSEARKIMHEVFDEFTINALYKIALKKHLDRLQYCISTGKEANVFRGVTADGEVRAYKIYRTETADFKAMWKYVQGDRRFRNVRRSKRHIVLAWCQKEFRNLQLAHDAGCRVPKPIFAHKNVLVMQFIGNEVAAPLMKDAAPENPEETMWHIAKDLRSLYAAGLVHADMSEFNVLMWNGLPYIIDIGQGVLLTHPYAGEFLERDCAILARYFTKQGVSVKAGELLDYVKV